MPWNPGDDVPGVVHQSQGWETFKEYAKEPMGAKAGVPGAGTGQNILTTIEFALSPFVPFSQDFTMGYGDVAGGGWAMHAQSDPGDATVDWTRRIDSYVGAQGGTLEDDVNNAPQGEMAERALMLSRQISRLLSSERIASKHDSTVVEELEAQAASHYMRTLFPTFVTSGSGFTGDIAMIQDGQLIKMGGRGKGTGETFDIYAKGESSRGVLEHSLHMLSRQANAGFVEGVRAIETTAMTSKKFFSVKMGTEVIEDLADLGSQFNAAVNDAVSDAIHEWKLLGRSLSDTYADIHEAGHKHGSKEDVHYFAKQLTSRLMEFQNQTFSGGELGTAFIFHVPIDQYTAGYARIEPVFTGADLTNILVDTQIVGGSAFEAIADSLKVTIDGEEYPIFYKEGENSVYSTHAQILLFDLWEQGVTDPTLLWAIVSSTNQDAMNDLALQSERGLTMGSALLTDLQMSMGALLQTSPVVTGVEIIGKKDAADIIKRQIEAFFENPSVSRALERFYKDAMVESDDVTNSWKTDINQTNFTISAPDGIFANDGGPFTDERNLQGVGIPFSFGIGRDPTGFEKFKKKHTHTKENVFRDIGNKKAKGVKIKAYRDEFSVPLDRFLPPGARARDEREHILDVRGRMVTQTWTRRGTTRNWGQEELHPDAMGMSGLTSPTDFYDPEFETLEDIMLRSRAGSIGGDSGRINREMGINP